MALYTDFTKGVLDASLTFMKTHKVLDAAFEPVDDVHVKCADYHLSYRIAGGLKKSSTPLPVEGAENPTANAVALGKLINSLTVCQVNSIRGILYQSNDGDIPARPIGSFPTKTFRWRCWKEDGSEYKDVSIAIPYFKTSGNGTDGAVNVVAQMTPYVRVFGKNDIVHFLG